MKFYSDYRQAINNRILSNLKKISEEILLRSQKRVVFKAVIFTDEIKESIHDKYLKKCQEMIEMNGLDGICYIYIIEFSDYNRFEAQMENVLNIEF